ncbi:hypothetical protein BDW22DRAFT_983887 [Trametopsis cervina]|nr:hypothetical protein BDW22DRAFT_983887 [Trametopsis cervina]
MLRRFLFLVAALSLVGSLHARPLDDVSADDTIPPTPRSEPATLMGRQYQLAKRVPLILMNPELEHMATEQKYHHESSPGLFGRSPSSETEPKPVVKHAEPLPRYVLERSLNTLEVRVIHTPQHTAAKQPEPNHFSEPPPPAPASPHITSDFITNEQKNKADTQTNGSPHVASHASSSGLGLSALGLGGAGSPGVAGLGLGGSGGSGHSSGGSGLNALGGLISG